MELLVWLVRTIVITLIIRVILGAVFGARRTTRGAQPRARVERSGGTLVRDPQCGTYLPASRAIAVRAGTQVLHFCSETCRAAYSSAHSSVA